MLLTTLLSSQIAQHPPSPPEKNEDGELFWGQRSTLIRRQIFISYLRNAESAFLVRMISSGTIFLMPNFTLAHYKCWLIQLSSLLCVHITSLVVQGIIKPFIQATIGYSFHKAQQADKLYCRSDDIL